MVANGELKYVLISALAATATLDAWVQEHGTAVDGYDGLYERYRRVTAALPALAKLRPMKKIKVLTVSAALTATLLLPAMAEAKATWT